MRQIYDASAAVVGNARYDPYGNVMAQSGATSVFAFAGEQQDATGLEYLRARYYSSAQGRFTTRDVWEGNPDAPMSYNAWNYTNGNPVNRTDPTGHCDPDQCPSTYNAWTNNLNCWLSQVLPPGLVATATPTCTPTRTPTATPSRTPIVGAPPFFNDPADVEFVAKGLLGEVRGAPEDIQKREIEAMAWTWRNQVVRDGAARKVDLKTTTIYHDEAFRWNGLNQAIDPAGVPMATDIVRKVMSARSNSGDTSNGALYMWSLDDYRTRGGLGSQTQAILDQMDKQGKLTRKAEWTQGGRPWGLYYSTVYPPDLIRSLTPTPTSTQTRAR